MAAETLEGGEQAKEALGEELFQAVENLFKDTQGGSAEVIQLENTSVIKGKGANNEDQVLLVPATTTTEVEVPGVGVVVTVPANVGLTFEGVQTGEAGVATFLGNQAQEKLQEAQQAIENSGGSEEQSEAVQKLFSSIEKGLNFLTKQGEAKGSTVTKANIINILDNSSTTGSEIKLDLKSSDGSGIAALNLNKVKEGNTVVVEGGDKLLAIGPGAIKVGGNVDASVAGDSRSQTIIGGAGNDTLVGGGGADTLTGGEGNNTFGLTATTQLTITDFDASKDKVMISLPGVTDIDSLKASVANSEFVNGNAVFTLNDGSVITLVGVDPNSITADLFLFDV